MALTKTNIVGFIALPDDTIPDKSSVTFSLTGFDTDDVAGTVIASRPVTSLLSVLGYLDVDLWPNENGERTTFYNVTINIFNGVNDVKIDCGKISIPATGGPYDLNDLLPIAPPSGATVSEYIAQLSAAASAASASAASAAADAAAAALYSPAYFFDTYADLVAYNDAWVVGQKVDVRGIGSYIVTAGASDVVDAYGNNMQVLAGPNGSVTQLAFGAVGDGVADDTLACQAAHDRGYRIGERSGFVFLVSSLTARVSVSGGEYKRKSGSSGDFIVYGADDVWLECIVDQNSVGGVNDAAIFNGGYTDCGTGYLTHVKNSTQNGIDFRNCDNGRIYGRVTDCIATHVFCKSETVDMNGLEINVTVDGSSLGTSNTQGGVKVHGVLGSWAVNAPIINASVKLAVDASMPSGSVCIETFGNVPNALVNGIVTGGNHGCTLNGSPNSIATIVARGNRGIGGEITNGSHGAVMTINASPIGAVTQQYSAQGGDSDNITFNVNSTEPSTALSTNSNVYLDGCNDVTVTGVGTRSGQGSYVRCRNTSGLTLTGLIFTGTGVTRAIDVDLAGGACDNLVATGCTFTGITNILNFSGNATGGIFSACKFGNSGAIFNSGITLSGYSMKSCVFGAHPFGSGVTSVDIINLVSNSANDNLISAVRSGTPVDWVSGAVGSTCANSSGGTGNVFYKRYGTASTSEWEI